MLFASDFGFRLVNEFAKLLHLRLFKRRQFLLSGLEFALSTAQVDDVFGSELLEHSFEMGALAKHLVLLALSFHSVPLLLNFRLRLFVLRFLLHQHLEVAFAVLQHFLDLARREGGHFLRALVLELKPLHAVADLQQLLFTLLKRELPLEHSRTVDVDSSDGGSGQ